MACSSPARQGAAKLNDQHSAREIYRQARRTTGQGRGRAFRDLPSLRGLDRLPRSWPGVRARGSVAASGAGSAAMTKKKPRYESRVFDGRIIHSAEIERIHKEVLDFKKGGSAGGTALKAWRRGRQWTAGPTKRDERPEGAYQISRQGGQHLGRPRGSARVAAREAQGWCEARRLCRSKDSGFSQSFPEESKEAPTQKVTRFIRLLPDW
jgi:hypothetical protein